MFCILQIAYLFLGHTNLLALNIYKSLTVIETDIIFERAKYTLKINHLILILYFRTARKNDKKSDSKNIYSAEFVFFSRFDLIKSSPFLRFVAYFVVSILFSFTFCCCCCLFNGFGRLSKLITHVARRLLCAVNISNLIENRNKKKIMKREGFLYGIFSFVLFHPSIICFFLLFFVGTLKRFVCIRWTFCYRVTKQFGLFPIQYFQFGQLLLGVSFSSWFHFAFYFSSCSVHFFPLHKSMFPLCVPIFSVMFFILALHIFRSLCYNVCDENKNKKEKTTRWISIDEKIEKRVSWIRIERLGRNQRTLKMLTQKVSRENINGARDEKHEDGNNYNNKNNKWANFVIDTNTVLSLFFHLILSHTIFLFIFLCRLKTVLLNYFYSRFLRWCANRKIDTWSTYFLSHTRTLVLRW